jgi:hypothetical protein
MQHKESNRLQKNLNQLQNSWKNEVKSLFPVTINPGFSLAPKKKKIAKNPRKNEIESLFLSCYQKAPEFVWQNKVTNSKTTQENMT